MLTASDAVAHPESPLSKNDKALLAAHGLEVKQIDVLADVPRGVSIDDVTSHRTAEFKPLEQRQIVAAHWYSSVWLRIRIQPSLSEAGKANEPVVVSLNKPFLDDVALFVPSTAGKSAWQVQRGGDALARADWTSEGLGLTPYFALPSSSQLRQAGATGAVLYLRIEQLTPWQSGLFWSSKGNAQSAQTYLLFTYGISIGIVLFALLSTAALAFSLRRGMFALFGCYALSVGMAAVSYCGLGHWLLWPQSGMWPSNSPFVFIVLACVFQGYLGHGIMREARQVNRGRWQPHALAAAGLPLSAAFVFAGENWHVVYATFAVFVALAVSTAGHWIVQAARARSQLAIAWLVVFIPFGLVFSWAILGIAGVVASLEWIHHFGVYSVAVEVGLLGMMLQLLGRERHAERERESALARIDPLTGCLDKFVFRTQLTNVWAKAEWQQLDMALAYVQLMSQGEDTPESERMLQQAVRIVRAATRTNDVVGRVDANVLGVLMPGVSQGDALSQRLARIVASGLMVDSSDPGATRLLIRIAATTRKTFDADDTSADADLRAALGHFEGWEGRNIRYVRRGNRPSVAPERPAASITMQVAWEAALAAEQAAASPAAAAPSVFSVTQPMGSTNSKPQGD